jgi:hypothetical protein
MTALAAAMMTLVATTATANEGNLAVSATITPAGGCVPSVQDDVDFGVVHPTDPEYGTGFNLDTKTVPLGVVCSPATRFAIRFTDLKADSVAFPGTQFFGLGTQADGHKIGGYALDIEGERPDPARFVMSRRDDIGIWEQPTVASARVHQNAIYGFANSSQAVEPDALTAIDLTLKISGRVASGLDKTEDVALQGEATIELVLL